MTFQQLRSQRDWGHTENTYRPPTEAPQAHLPVLAIPHSWLTQVQSTLLTSRQAPVPWSCLQPFYLASDCHLSCCCCSSLEEEAVNRGHRGALLTDPAPGPPPSFPQEAPSLCTPQTKVNPIFLFTLGFP